jgi:hypothetical protein
MGAYNNNNNNNEQQQHKLCWEPRPVKIKIKTVIKNCTGNYECIFAVGQALVQTKKYVCMAHNPG